MRTDVQVASNGARVPRVREWNPELAAVLPAELARRTGALGHGTDDARVTEFLVEISDGAV
jgi:hypothetical protein